MAAPLPVVFVGASVGPWHIERISPVVGETLPGAPYLSVLASRDSAGFADASFALRGSTGHVRYVSQHEKTALAAVTPPLGRPEATCAALIPIRKSDAWWELAQDERRAILEERSQHIALGIKYLPAIARRLYHARELGEAFDFLTWFEFAREHASRFEELVFLLRASEEWKYVEREVDIRLAR